MFGAQSTGRASTRAPCLSRQSPVSVVRDSQAEVAGPAASVRRVLGIDTALRSSGLALVQERQGRLEALEYEIVKNPPARSLSHCLRHLYQSVEALIRRGQPTAVAIEGIFFCKNVKTAVILGEARGVVIAACAACDVPVFEYSPRRVKQAVVGVGSADKEQVRKMVMALLNLTETPHEDASDALAIALCHLHQRGRWEALAPKPV